LARYLSLAFLHHQPAISHFLLAVNCPVLLVFWNQMPFLWTFEELMDLTKLRC
jgi:hypothetical protein